MSREILPTTTMTGILRALLGAFQAHAWPSPIAQIGLRGATDLIQTDLAALVVATPALYLNIASRSHEDPRTDPRERAFIRPRLIRNCEFEVYCLLDETRTRDAAIEIYEMVEAVCALVEQRVDRRSPHLGNRWGLDQAARDPESLTDDESDLGLQGIAARVVRWQQVFYLAETPPPS